MRVRDAQDGEAGDAKRYRSESGVRSSPTFAARHTIYYRNGSGAGQDCSPAPVHDTVISEGDAQQSEKSVVLFNIR
jgi:hypothetical protein